ncbi:MAG: hypothetical protein ABJE95_30325 [Byssovorax sp.]
MIPVAPVPEPASFDETARRPGNAWVAEHPGARRPRDYWSRFRGILADGFANRCGYSAMHEPVGTVDHFRSIATDPQLTYEWTNYRFASPWLNSSKGSSEVLDPYEVGEGWFEVLLPSLQLVLTEKIPAEIRGRAEATLRRLPIEHDERILKQRRRWYQHYLDGKLSFEGLSDNAPLIAAAVRKQLAEGDPRLREGT